MPYTIARTGEKVRKGDVVFFQHSLEEVLFSGPQYTSMRPITVYPRVPNQEVGHRDRFELLSRELDEAETRGAFFLIPPDMVERTRQLLTLGYMERRNKQWTAYLRYEESVAYARALFSDSPPTLHDLFSIPEGSKARMELARELATTKLEGVRALVLGWTEPLLEKYLEEHGFDPNADGFGDPHFDVLVDETWDALLAVSGIRGVWTRSKVQDDSRFGFQFRDLGTNGITITFWKKAPPWFPKAEVEVSFNGRRQFARTLGTLTGWDLVVYIKHCLKDGR